MCHARLSRHLPAARWQRCSLLVALAFLTHAAVAADTSAPPGRIHDDARALPLELAETLSGEIRAFEAATGCQFYLATVSYLEGSSIRAYAKRLADAWLGGKAGVVLGFDRGSSSFTFSPGEALWKRYPVPALVEVFSAGGAVLRDDTKVLEQRLVEASRLCLREITRLERQRSAQSRLLSRQDRYFAIGFLAATFVAALGVAALITRRREQEIASSVEHLFPPVEVGIRLGAPHGGGVIAEVRF